MTSSNIWLKAIAALFILAFAGISCGDDGPDLSSDELIQQYLTANNITAEKTASGLYYVIDEPGTSEMPTRSSTVTVHYHGYLLNGDVFDSSVDRGEPLEISLRSVIAGWTEGIPLFGKGGKGALYIPSQLGYGSQGTSSGSIPPNTPIAFDIELIDFK